MHSQHQAYSLSHRLASLLRQSNHTLAVAESCTAGGLSQVITAVDGASAFFTHGFVTYSNEAKQTMLGVPKSELETNGAVSAEVARSMALGALQSSRASMALSITGIAGPGGGTPEKPVGLVWFGLAWGDAQTVTLSAHFGGGRHAVRRQAIEGALMIVIEHIENSSTSIGESESVK